MIFDQSGSPRVLELVDRGWASRRDAPHEDERHQQQGEQQDERSGTDQQSTHHDAPVVRRSVVGRARRTLAAHHQVLDATERKEHGRTAFRDHDMHLAVGHRNVDVSGGDPRRRGVTARCLGGQAMVPFAPRNDRPGYCSTCYDNVRAGTLEESSAGV